MKPPVEPIISAQDPEVYTIEEFCARHKLGRTYFYEVLRPAGLAPLLTELGTRRLITRESAARWRAEMTGRNLPSRSKRAQEVPPA
jgi:hypothetical protein